MVGITSEKGQRQNLKKRKHPRKGAILMQSIVNQTEHAIIAVFHMIMEWPIHHSAGMQKKSKNNKIEKLTQNTNLYGGWVRV